MPTKPERKYDTPQKRMTLAEQAGWKKLTEQTGYMSALAQHAAPLETRVIELEAEVRELREAGKWIPVELAIPKPEKNVRVRYADGTTEDDVYWREEGRCCMLGPRAGSYPPGWNSTEAGHLPVDDITHWMPLPTPPQEGSTNY